MTTHSCTQDSEDSGVRASAIFAAEYSHSLRALGRAALPPVVSLACRELLESAEPGQAAIKIRFFHPSTSGEINANENVQLKCILASDCAVATYFVSARFKPNAVKMFLARRT